MATSYLLTNYTGALKAFTAAIEADGAIETTKLASFHVKRAATHLKLKNYDEALDDGTKPWSLTRTGCPLAKRPAAFHLEEFETAKAAFVAGRTLLQGAGGDVSNYETWIRKCDAELEDLDSSDDDNEDATITPLLPWLTKPRLGKPPQK